MSGLTDGSAGRAFGAFTEYLHSILPTRVRKLVPQTFIGFAMINSTTFAIDILLLSFSTRVLHWPYPLAVTLSFGIAASIAFFLNKFLNFRAHGNVGKQSGKYMLVLVSNYVIWLLGFSSFLNAVGVPPEIARMAAGVCEGIYIYLLSRLWVFGRTKQPQRQPAHEYSTR